MIPVIDLVSLSLATVYRPSSIISTLLGLKNFEITSEAHQNPVKPLRRNFMEMFVWVLNIALNFA